MSWYRTKSSLCDRLERARRGQASDHEALFRGIELRTTSGPECALSYRDRGAAVLRMLMSASGQTRRFDNVRATSAFHPIATESRQRGTSAQRQKATWGSRVAQA